MITHIHTHAHTQTVNQGLMLSAQAQTDGKAFVECSQPVKAQMLQALLLGERERVTLLKVTLFCYLFRCLFFFLKSV